jgi:hypothetical protein
MTKDAVIQSFFESFGLNAYPATSVPTGSDAPNFPYITYTAPTDWDMGRVVVSASVWYRGTSWTALNAKVKEISQAIGGAKPLVCDEGGIIIRKSTPWAQPMGDDIDNMIKRKILTFEFLYATIY